MPRSLVLVQHECPAASRRTRHGIHPCVRHLRAQAQVLSLSRSAAAPRAAPDQARPGHAAAVASTAWTSPGGRTPRMRGCPYGRGTPTDPTPDPSRVHQGVQARRGRAGPQHRPTGEIYLFKNNTDSAGNSYGCHENYLVSRHGEFGRLADILIPFLVTRQLICGAGKVLQTPRGAVYCLSQRAEHIWEGVSSATTRSRPIINTRDEPHADAERYRRLHVIVGDSNMNEVTTLLKVGSADIVLRMIEAGVAMRDLTLENPIRAIREVSPRHHRPAQGPAGQRQGVQRAGDPAGVLRQGERVRRAPRLRRHHQAGPRPVGPGAGRRSSRATCPGSSGRSTGSASCA